MAAILQLLDYMDRQKEREQRMRFEEVKMEAYKRSMGKMAVEEGKAMAIKDAAMNVSNDFLNSKNSYERLQAEVAVRSQDPRTQPETLNWYNNALKNAQAAYESDRLRLQKVNMEAKILAGPITNKNQKSFLDDIMDEKDPYDQIKETRKSSSEDAITGASTETIQEGPASAFRGAVNPYAPAYNTTSGALFGNTAAGGMYDEEPEVSYGPVGSQRSTGTSVNASGATQLNPAATQPVADPFASQNTNPIASAPQADQASVRKEAEAILKNPNIPPEKKQQVRERAAKLGVTL